MIDVLLCTALLATHTPAQQLSEGWAFDVCREVAQAAVAHDLPPALAVSLAYWESKLHPTLTNPISGAYGPLQVIAKWHCPNGKDWEGCGSPIDAGMRALRAWYALSGVWAHWGWSHACTHWVWELEDRRGGRRYAIEGYVGVGDGGSRTHALQIVKTSERLEASLACACSTQ